MTAVILVLTSGCVTGSSEESRPIGEASSLTITTSENLVSVEPDWSRNVTDPCPVLRADIAAEVGGVGMEIVSPGAWTGEFDGANECELPHIALSAPPASARTLDVRDGRGMVHCDLGDALEPRTVSLEPAGPWQLAVGQRATLRWSHPADANVDSFTLTLVVGEQRIPVDDVVRSDDRFTFTVPSSSAPGIYRLEINGHHMGGGERCGGIATSRYENHTVLQQVTVTP